MGIKMKIIGITGSVGSGKTTVSRVFEQQFGARALITDEIAHRMMEPGTEGYKRIVGTFGNGILEESIHEYSPIDRKKLAQDVFSKPECVQKINNIIHPLVNHYVAQEIKKERERAKLSWLVIESALLIECGYEKICDELWYITADDEVRRERLKHSRGYSDEKIDSILKNQLSDQIFRETCAHILYNNGDISEIAGQIKVLLEL